MTLKTNVLVLFVGERHSMGQLILDSHGSSNIFSACASPPSGSLPRYLLNKSCALATYENLADTQVERLLDMYILGSLYRRL